MNDFDISQIGRTEEKTTKSIKTYQVSHPRARPKYVNEAYRFRMRWIQAQDEDHATRLFREEFLVDESSAIDVRECGPTVPGPVENPFRFSSAHPQPASNGPKGPWQ